MEALLLSGLTLPGLERLRFFLSLKWSLPGDSWSGSGTPVFLQAGPGKLGAPHVQALHLIPLSQEVGQKEGKMAWAGVGGGGDVCLVVPKDTRSPPPICSGHETPATVERECPGPAPIPSVAWWGRFQPGNIKVTM